MATPEAVSAAAVPLASVECPPGIPEEQQAVWAMLAPLAVERRTLTPATALAFRDLCEAIIVKRELLAIIQKDGYTISKVTLQMDESGGGVQLMEPKAHPLLSQFRGLMQRVETGLARFRLTGDGKAIEADQEPKALSPLEKLQQQARQMKRG